MNHQIVLFHSGLGLRPAVLDFAERMRSEGHTVHTPDLYEGEVFNVMEEGERKRDALGVPELMRRAEEAVAGLPEGLVLAGFSMGAAAAQYLAATSPKAKAAVLMHGALPPAAMGLEAWPLDVAVQVHYGERDESVDPRDIETFAAMARLSARAEVHTYPRAGHLFSDEGFADFESESAKLMLQRVLAFLASV